MLSVTRYRLTDDPAADAEFLAQAGSALELLAQQPGFVAGRLARNLDEPDLALLVTEWDLVGNYRRALGNPQVKMVVLPLLYRCLDEPSAYTDALTITPNGELRVVGNDLAPESATRGVRADDRGR